MTIAPPELAAWAAWAWARARVWVAATAAAVALVRVERNWRRFMMVVGASQHQGVGSVDTPNPPTDAEKPRGPALWPKTVLPAWPWSLNFFWDESRPRPENGTQS